MMYNINISEAAEEDVREAFLWYEDKKEGLGMEFKLLFSQAVESIQSNPLKTQVRYANIRVFFLDRFPYGIHFKVTDHDVLIVSVFGTKEHPKKWTKRNK